MVEGARGAGQHLPTKRRLTDIGRRSLVTPIDKLGTVEMSVV